MYRHAATRSEDELLNLAGALDGKPVAAEFLLNGRKVVANLSDGAEADLSQDQHQRLIGQRNVPATAFQRAHLTQNLTPEEEAVATRQSPRPRKGRVYHAAAQALGTEAQTEGQMLQRVMPDLMGMKRILALNDEAHHCYREKPAGEDEEGPLKGDDRKEAERNREAARVWISGLEAPRGWSSGRLRWPPATTR